MGRETFHGPPNIHQNEKTVPQAERCRSWRPRGGGEEERDPEGFTTKQSKEPALRRGREGKLLDNAWKVDEPDSKGSNGWYLEGRVEQMKEEMLMAVISARA